MTIFFLCVILAVVLGTLTALYIVLEDCIENIIYGFWYEKVLGIIFILIIIGVIYFLVTGAIYNEA